MANKIDLKNQMSSKITGTKKGIDALISEQDETTTNSVIKNKREEKITVCITKKYHKTLKRIALEHDMKLLDVINDAIEKYIIDSDYNNA
jgi:hypothetical protein